MISCFLEFLGVTLILFVVFVCGFHLAGNDAERRLTGKLPVDEYWRKRGMK